MQINWKSLLKKTTPVLAGAILGYGYYYFVGCNSGTCLITSNPVYSTLYGTLIGAVFTFPNKKKEKANDDKNSEDKQRN